MEYKKKNFREKMISDYYRKIIEKRTEIKLLEADIAGLFSKVAEEIEFDISRFDGKALLTLRKCKTIGTMGVCIISGMILWLWTRN